jgi:hypothetical protein
MPNVEVNLDTNATPPVTTNPKEAPVDHGNGTVTWRPKAGQTFTFVSLTGLPNPPFSAPVITPGSVSVSDSYTNPGTYPYVITVIYNGVTYSSAGGGLGGTGGSSTVKNK